MIVPAFLTSGRRVESRCQFCEAPILLVLVPNDFGMTRWIYSVDGRELHECRTLDFFASMLRRGEGPVSHA